MAESRPNGRLPWWRRHWLKLTLLGMIVLLGYAVLAAIVLPDRIVSVSEGNADANHRLDAIGNTRTALLGVLAPVVVAIGAVAAFLNYRETSDQNRRTLKLSRDTLDVTRRGQLTERFTKAIEQLGQTEQNKLDIRLGGIYALERIAKESEELHGPVMEILTAFLREHSPKLASKTSSENQKRAHDEADHAAMKETRARLRTDFQAIATVLGRRDVSHDPDGFRLDLRGVALHRVDFTGAQLQKAHFQGAQLQGASFYNAELQGASFYGAQLQGANFIGAELQGASFYDAQLQGAVFYFADLERAQFAGPPALGLTWDQLSHAENVNKADLPDYLTKGKAAGPDK